MNLQFDLIAIDLETTGCDPFVYSICQIGLAIVKKDLTIVATYSSVVLPLDDSRDPRAMEIHGISEETLSEAPTFAMVLMEIKDLYPNVHKLVPAAWGTHFDLHFLRVQCRRLNIGWPFSGKSFDIKTAAMWEMAKNDSATSGGISKVLRSLGTDFEGRKHNALSDILNAVRILQILGGKENASDCSLVHSSR